MRGPLTEHDYLGDVAYCKVFLLHQILEMGEGVQTQTG